MNALPVLLATLALAAVAHGQRTRIRFDDSWRFKLDQSVGGAVPVTGWTYRESRLGVGSPIRYSDLEDEVEADWKPTKPGQETFRNRIGFNWYKATLPAFHGAKPTLVVDQVDDNAVVFLNGQELHRHVGYGVEFTVDLTSAWKASGPNEVVILVENTGGWGSLGKVALTDAANADKFEEAQPSFNDTTWRNLHLPHDFVVEGQYDPDADGSHGFLPGGLGWYRKSFVVPASDKGKRIWIDFDGVFRNSTVWVNGKELGTHLTGYAPFRYDLTDVLNYGGRNVVSVRVDARKAEGWWYEGGGIYRHVWLNKADPVHIVPNGVFVSTKEVAGGHDVTVETEVTNSLSIPQRFTLTPTVRDKNGSKVAAATMFVDLKPGETKKASVVFALRGKVHLWSLEDPYLYKVEVPVTRAGRVVDSVSHNFGVRTLRFDADKGFFLNGKPVKLKGTCNHQDFAGVGVAMPDRLLEWRIKKLKEMGSNAYRCSHNMVADELLDACDRLGMLVMDENRHLGDAAAGKTPHGTPLGDMADLKMMVKRDRNHPSVIMWSMCNEEGLQGTDEGAELFKGMRNAVLELDPTRPVTAAMNGGWGHGFTFVQDIQGINYSPTAYDEFHKDFPKMPLMGSETASEVGTRGEYANDSVKGYVSAYGRNAPPWAQPAEVAWKAVADRDFVMGGFVWTGFDYRGEPTPYNWPCVNSHFGVMDMCGFPKDTWWYYKAWWDGAPTVHILPHWNWADQDRNQTKEVWIQTNAQSVELFLNGKSLGTKPGVRLGHVEFMVPYEPGVLEARGKMADGSVVVDRVETTGKATQLKLIPYWTRFNSDQEDICLVEVQALDAQGRLVPTADEEITFVATGAAKVVGVGNGDPSNHEPNRVNYRRLFHGRALVVLQAGSKKGSVRLRATYPSLKSDTVKLRVN